MQNNRSNIIVWGFFSLIFIASNVLLLQRFPNPSLLSAVIALSLTFILDQILKKQRIQKENLKTLKASSKQKRKTPNITNKSH